jgi:hypothetical protein
VRYFVIGLLLIPLFELGAHAWIVQHVPSPRAYREASAFIREQLEPRDLITAAPAFIDPIVRWQLGDRMPLAMAARNSDTRYTRMWVLSIRGALPKNVPSAAPELSRDFGPVRVLRYRLAQNDDNLLFDFVENWENAAGTRTRAGVSEACPLRTGGFPRGGGLGKAVLMPVRKRLECDARTPWFFIAPVVLEGLDNEPHYCIWQHPMGPEPVTLTYRDVPLGAELWFMGGLYYEHERMREGAAIDATISIDGQPSAQFHHVDGMGFTSIHIPTSALGKTRATVSVSVQTQDTRGRSFCWAAETRSRPLPQTGPAP